MQSSYAPLPNELKEELQAFYAPHNEHLRQFLGEVYPETDWAASFKGWD
jgi:hypothetical protein